MQIKDYEKKYDCFFVGVKGWRVLFIKNYTYKGIPYLSLCETKKTLNGKEGFYAEGVFYELD